MISWVEQGRVPEKTETRGKARVVLVACSMFDPKVFKMNEGVLMFSKAANWKGMLNIPPGVHGNQDLESMSSE